MIKKPIAQLSLESGGILKPLIISPHLLGGTGVINPSIFIDGDDTIMLLRHVNYSLYHSEKKQILHEWGPLVYVHPETYQKLKTTNYYCVLDEDYNIKRCSVVNTNNLDVEPMWDFVGLEDARLVRWDDKLYLSGVRRDTTTNGQGRIELSEISVTDTDVTEISRVRIQPIHENSYCEKNWMPFIDKTYHYIKWTNPTEVVKADIQAKKIHQVYVGNYVEGYRDMRGGSQVLPWKGNYIAITHEVDLYNDYLGRKDAKYTHRIVLWDKDYNIIKWSDDFTFMNGHIEFCAGMCYKDGNFLITFGFRDNCSFLLKLPETVMEDIINGTV